MPVHKKNSVFPPLPEEIAHTFMHCIEFVLVKFRTF